MPSTTSPARRGSKGAVTEAVICGAERRDIGLLPQAPSSPSCTFSAVGYAILRRQERIPTEQGGTLLAGEWMQWARRADWHLQNERRTDRGFT